MRILLFGGTGQLGYEVIERARALHFELSAPVESELDISDYHQVEFIVGRAQPDVVINCAAYTAVDKAESERERVFKVNAEGPANIARAVRGHRARLIHLSTDYVYPGDGNRPLREDDPAGPRNVYGASKLEGDRAVLETLAERALVVRISSLHGQKGLNFVHTMLRLFAEREVVKVVDDQFMSPTWAGWLAEVLLDLARIDCSGVVHACGKGAVSWHGFAQAIYSRAKPKLKREVRIEPIKAVDYPVAAVRPAYSVLDCSKLAKFLGREPIPWEEGLRRHMAEIGY